MQPKGDKYMYAKKDLSQISKNLLLMANWIETCGWCQGRTHGPHDEVCIMGAGYRTIYDYPGKTYMALNNHLKQEPAAWNDEKGRTKEQVLIMLKELAYNLDE